MSFFSLITGSCLRNFNTSRKSFIETEPYEKGFAKHYEENIKPHVDAFEEKRIISLKKVSIHIRIAICIVIMLLFCTTLILNLFELDANSIKILTTVVVFIFCALALWVYESTHKCDKYEKLVRSEIFTKIISFIESFQYVPQCSLQNYTGTRYTSLIEPPQNTDNSFQRVRDFYNQDIKGDISGNYKDVNINIFGVGIMEDRGKCFKEYLGQTVISFSLNKNFNSSTMVVSKSYITVTELERVKLEDIKFESIFDIYSDNQVEARYLLTTSFMNRLIKLSKFFGSKSMECIFDNNKLFIRVSGEKSLFNSGSIYQPVNFVEDSKILLKEMNIIFNIVDSLKISHNIGM